MAFWRARPACASSPRGCADGRLRHRPAPGSRSACPSGVHHGRRHGHGRHGRRSSLRRAGVRAGGTAAPRGACPAAGAAAAGGRAAGALRRASSSALRRASSSSLALSASSRSRSSRSLASASARRRARSSSRSFSSARGVLRLRPRGPWRPASAFRRRSSSASGTDLSPLAPSAFCAAADWAPGFGHHDALALGFHDDALGASTRKALVHAARPRATRRPRVSFRPYRSCDSIVFPGGPSAVCLAQALAVSRHPLQHEGQDRQRQARHVSHFGVRMPNPIPGPSGR
jgi:hypothetical protein